MFFCVVCMVLDQVKVCYIRYSLVQINNVVEVGKSTNVISIGVARKSEGTIVLKEIVVIFIVLRDRVWHFGMVHRFVGKMTIVYEVTEFGQMFVSVLIIWCHFCDDLWSNPCCMLLNVVNKHLAMGICSQLLVSITAPHRDNELKHGIPDHHRDEEGFRTLGPMTLLLDKVQGLKQVSAVRLTFLIGVLFCITLCGRTRERVSVPQEYLGRHNHYWRQGQLFVPD